MKLNLKNEKSKAFGEGQNSLEFNLERTQALYATQLDEEIIYVDTSQISSKLHAIISTVSGIEYKSAIAQLKLFK